MDICRGYHVTEYTKYFELPELRLVSVYRLSGDLS